VFVVVGAVGGTAVGKNPENKAVPIGFGVTLASVFVVVVVSLELPNRLVVAGCVWFLFVSNKPPETTGAWTAPVDAPENVGIGAV